ncbi:MAG: 50S ribosomal protein L10 [Thermodesulfobacteriota bacterium]
MTRTEKENVVKELNKKFEDAKFAFVTDYSGLNVADISELRRRLRDESAEFKVVVNTLTRLAVKNTGFDVLTDFLQGPVAVAVGAEDSATVAKVLTEFAKDQPNLEIKAGILDGKVISIEEVKALASLPSRKVLLGKLVSLLNAIPTGFVRVLNGVPQGLVFVLKSLEAKKSKED